MRLFALQHPKPLRKISGSRWQRLRVAVLSDNPLCVQCLKTGRVTSAAEVDHIVPVHKGGTDELHNLQPLCKPCHESKTRRDLGQRERFEIGIDGWPKTTAPGGD